MIIRLTSLLPYFVFVSIIQGVIEGMYFISPNLVSTVTYARYLILFLSASVVLLLFLKFKKAFHIIFIFLVIFFSLLLLSLFFQSMRSIEIRFDKFTITSVISGFSLIVAWIYTYMYESSFLNQHSCGKILAKIISLTLIIGFIAVGLILNFQGSLNLQPVRPDGISLRYSQDLTSFFGILALISFYGFVELKVHWFKKLFILISCAIFLTYTFIGGARGELLSSLFVMFFIIFTADDSNLIRKVCYILFIIIAIVMSYIFGFLDRFVFLIDSDFENARFDIYITIINNLFVEDMILLGNGFNFTQSLFPIRMYDSHNFVLDIVLTYGWMLGLIFMIFLIHGLYKINKYSLPMSRLLYMCMLFHIIIFLKSGSLENGIILSIVSFVMSISIYHLSSSLFKINNTIDFKFK
mgnify:CR=1 FL=1